MHPNAFLTTLWRAEIKEQLFVAMSFAPRFLARYEEIIRPAIEDEPIAGTKLSAYRVDNSKTGDSILTDIVNGIAHSRLVLADVSVIDEGRYTEVPIRSGNVMYEVGVALACRNSSEVLLIRDDEKEFLFDVSTIPHLKIDFSDSEAAIKTLRSAIAERLMEINLLQDARIRIAVSSLTQDETRILNELVKLPPDRARNFEKQTIGQPSIPDARGLDGLLAKGCIKSVAVNTESRVVFYALTPFGYALAQAADELLLKIQPTDEK